MTSGDYRLGHRPALDGVRGIAILLVLAAHANTPLANTQGGKAGVAAFFTLSGFLITALLLGERTRTGTVSLRRFYTRRARRLMPAQVVLVLVVATFTLPIATSDFLSWTDPLAAMTYTKNLTEPYDMLGHFWSLALEEQFYLTWAPVLVWLLARNVDAARLVPWLVGLAMLSLTGRVLMPTGTEVVGVHVAQLLPIQADPILLGCALAVWMHGRPEGRTRPVVALVALGALIIAAQFSEPFVAQWGVGIAGVAAAALIYATANGPGPEWTRNPIFVWFGLRSYSLYLWHWPLCFAAKYAFGIGEWTILLAVAIVPTLVLAELSYQFVEQPFRASRQAAQTSIVQAPTSPPTAYFGAAEPA